MLEYNDGNKENGGHREDRISYSNSSTLDTKILFATNGVYHKLAEKTGKECVSDFLHIPFISKTLSGEERYPLEQEQKTAIEEAQNKISKTRYKFVITEIEEIAEAAAQNDITSILIRSTPESDERLIEKNPGSYILNTSRKGCIDSLSQLLNYKENPAVLIVEDDRPNLLLNEQEFQDAGYEVKTAETVEEAYKILEQGKIDAVITDLRLPFQGEEHGTAGLYVLHKVQSNYPDTPVIFHTGTKSENIFNIIKGLGVYDIVPKSIDSTQKLLELVNTALNKKDLSLFSDDETMKKIDEKIDGPETTTERFVAEFEKPQKELASKSP